MTSYIVRCRVSGGVTGTRETELKHDGKVLYFDSFHEAQAKAVQLEKERNTMFATAFYRYWPEKVYRAFNYAGELVRVTIPDDEDDDCDPGAGARREKHDYFFLRFSDAVANAHLWNGRCSVIPSGKGFEVVGGSRDYALYSAFGQMHLPAMLRGEKGWTSR